MDGMLSNRCLNEIIQTNQCGFALVKIGQFLKHLKCKKCALYFRLVANQYHSEEKPPSIRRLLSNRCLTDVRHVTGMVRIT